MCLLRKNSLLREIKVSQWWTVKVIRAIVIMPQLILLSQKLTRWIVKIPKVRCTICLLNKRYQLQISSWWKVTHWRAKILKTMQMASSNRCNKHKQWSRPLRWLSRTLSLHYFNRSHRHRPQHQPINNKIKWTCRWWTCSIASSSDACLSITRKRPSSVQSSQPGNNAKSSRTRSVRRRRMP